MDWMTSEYIQRLFAGMRKQRLEPFRFKDVTECFAESPVNVGDQQRIIESTGPKPTMQRGGGGRATGREVRRSFAFPRIGRPMRRFPCVARPALCNTTNRESYGRPLHRTPSP